MQVLLDVRTSNDHFPGIGRYAYHLAHAFSRRPDIDALILMHNPSWTHSRYDLSALASESKVRMLSTGARPFTVREQLQLPVELRQFAPEVIHFPYMIMPYAVPRPAVVTIHDLIPMHLPQHFSRWQRFAYRVAMSLALRSAAAVICVSEATRSDLQSAFGVIPADISVVHEGVGEQFHPRRKDEIEHACAKHGLSEGYFLYVGSNKPHKNLSLLVQAYSHLQNPPLLVMAGAEDPRYPQARRGVEFLKLKDRVRFIGAVPEKDLAALYSGASAFVFPSLYEGFGLPPLEAMACGIPVVCSDIPSLREVVGDAALLFNPVQPAALKTALDRILTDKKLRHDLRARGFQRAASLSWDQTAQQTLNVYRRLNKNGMTPA